MAGFVGTLLGIGGGAIMVPVLALLGVPVSRAAPASLVAILGTSGGGLRTLFRRGLVDWKLAVFLETGSGLGAVAGVVLHGIVSERVLRLLLAAALLVSGAGFLWLERLRGPVSGKQGLSSSPLKLAVGWLVSFAAGVVSALLGVGGGVVKVPILVFVLGLPVKTAVATSKLMVGITASVGVMGYVVKGAVDWGLAIPLLVGTFTGATLASRVLVAAREKSIRTLASAYYFAMSVLLLLRGR